jgi:hypothetical protein
MITRNRILFIVGLWNVLLPFLGFPSTIRTILIVLSGLVMVLIAFLFSRDKRLGFGVSHGSRSDRPIEPQNPHGSTPKNSSANEPSDESDLSIENYLKHSAQPIRSPYGEHIARSTPAHAVGATAQANQPSTTEDHYTDLKSILKK